MRLWKLWEALGSSGPAEVLEEEKVQPFLSQHGQVRRVPSCFRCPVTEQFFVDPVVNTENGALPRAPRADSARHSTPE